MIFSVTSADVKQLYAFAKKSVSTIDVQIKNAVSSLFALFGSYTIVQSSSQVQFAGESPGGLPLFYDMEELQE